MRSIIDGDDTLGANYDPWPKTPKGKIMKNRTFLVLFIAAATLILTHNLCCVTTYSMVDCYVVKTFAADSVSHVIRLDTNTELLVTGAYMEKDTVQIRLRTP